MTEEPTGAPGAGAPADAATPADTAPGARPAASPPPPPPPEPRGRRSRGRNAVEWVAVVVGAVVVALLVKTFLVQAYKIPSESMEPTLAPGDRVLVNKLSYDLHDINRGDVVVFHRPEGWQQDPDAPDDLIKRVIGLPGDTLVAKDGEVYVNGERLEEPYVPDGVPTTNLDEPVEVPEGEIFVMGDNRENSFDSRFNGTVDEDLVVGRAFLVMWPLDRIGTL